MPRFWPHEASPTQVQVGQDQHLISAAHGLHDRPRMERELGDLRLMTSDPRNGTVAKRRARGVKAAKTGAKTTRAASGRRHAEAPPESRPRRKVLAVTSGKGGVGKTNIV